MPISTFQHFSPGSDLDYAVVDYETDRADDWLD